MSLVRLLSTGKSLVGGATDSTSRYRMGNPGMLPKFGSGVKPIPTGIKGQGGLVCEKETPDQSTGKKEKVPLASTSPKRNSSLRTIYRSWLSGVKARVARLYVKPPRPALPRSAKAHVQTELSLDKVRVVRNDLSDTDLEVVPVRAGSGLPVLKPSFSQSMEGPAEGPNKTPAPGTTRGMDAAPTVANR